MTSKCKSGANGCHSNRVPTTPTELHRPRKSCFRTFQGSNTPWKARAFGRFHFRSERESELADQAPSARVILLLAEMPKGRVTPSAGHGRPSRADYPPAPRK